MCLNRLRWYHYPLIWLGIVRRLDPYASVMEGGICEQCRKSCIENCSGTCYCNTITGACLCQ